jgi:predicted DsbA family dithiol-disulfide isomerase
MVKLDIISDPVCPWCMIGKARLDRALEARADHPFEIEWHPFQLNPEMPEGGMERPAYLEAKFGGKARAAEIYARIDEAARDSGIEIDWAAIPRIPNTLDAHRLIHWAGLEERQSSVVDALFRAYWQEGRDIGDRDTLADIADAAGMDAATVRRLLAGDADLEDVRSRDAHARERGVTGVPTFVVANQHVVPGAQPAALWEKLIDEISEQIRA